MRSPSRRNPRYRAIDPPDDADLGMIAAKVQYIGSPEHKQAPSFAGPPSPRPDASICDSRFLNMQDELTGWLRDAIRRGAVSAHFEGGYPRYAWFKDGDVVYEARLVNRGKGTYKGLKRTSGPTESTTYMADLDFDIEWIEPESTQIPEHEATWAAVRILVDGKPITRFYDERLESVRKTLIVPVYPLAEWLASHWWNLLYESVTSGRTDDTDYAHRHNLRYGRSGYALPDVQFTPTGESVSVQWTGKQLTHYETEFLESGQAWVERPAFEHELTQVLDMVTHRLDQQGVKNTPLQADWTYIKTTGGDERAFCEAAARLGFHPYSIPEAEEQAILDVAQRVPESLYPSFFGAAHADRITDQAERLVQAFLLLHALDTRADELLDLKEEVAPYTPRYAPWEEGYEYARMLRDILDQRDAVFSTTEDVTQAFFLDGNGTQESVQEYDSAHLFTTLVVNNEHGVPGFAIDKHRDDARKFAFCRGMFEYLNADNGQPHMVTREQTERQKRNRAFAAEFLAPSSLLAEAVTGSTIDEEKVEDIAETFGVSSLVIQHQLLNHHIVDEIIP